MVYGLIIFGSLSGIAVPEIKGMISRTVGDNEQGGIEGSLTSLQSVPSAIRPPLATGVFGFFIGSKAPAIVPGAPFFLSSGLAVKQRCRPRGVFGEIRRRGDHFSRRLAEKIRREEGENYPNVRIFQKNYFEMRGFQTSLRYLPKPTSCGGFRFDTTTYSCNSDKRVA